MEINEIEHKELARDIRKELNNEFDTLIDRADRLKEYQTLHDGLVSLMAINEEQREFDNTILQYYVNEE